MSLALHPAPALPTTDPAPIRVMVVDDAVVVRGLVSLWVAEQPGLAVVASLRTGRQAVDQLERADPDVVVLDIDMPELDGISALPLLLEKKRDLVVIMASTLTRRNAEISLKALALGAADYVPKPDTNRGITTSTAFRRELIEKIVELGGRRRRRRGEASGRPVALLRPGLRPLPAGAQPIALRAFSIIPPRVLLVGASTGGPQALRGLASQLATVCDRVPVLITQHMPPTFTTIMAEHLARASGRPAHEPQDGEPIRPGTIYLAPGGRHMQVERRDRVPVVALDDGPLVNFCRPAVDPLFASAAQVWGGAILALVLTGMGADGARGAAAIVAAGGSIVAQDEASSVVWGMPGAVARAGLCSAVLPLDRIAPKLVELFTGAGS
jgi:two-component system, chemotaxis family, protein-glutamate methylesterase/glutaminase